MSAKTQSDVLSQCREMVVEHAPEITQALIDKAIDGSYQHAKFLFDFAFPPAPKRSDEEEDLPGPSLAEILLASLAELEEDPTAESSADA